MLKHLDISNVALIEKLSIDFDQGLNVLTGETGAGKSIIVDSINALLGERTNRELIRTGAESAYVEGLFQMPVDGFPAFLRETGIEPEQDGTLLLSREIQLNGRNICRVNGRLATVSILKELGENLIDVHGQHDSQSLLRTSSHTELLDSFGGGNIKEAKALFIEALAEFKQIKASLDKINKDNRDREKRIDILKYQIAEIEGASLKITEEEELQKQKAILSNAEKISNALSSALGMLADESENGKSARDGLNDAITEIKTISRFSEIYANVYSELEDMFYKLEDIVTNIRNERDVVDFTPGLLDSVEERLNVIEKLKRKYGGTIEGILQYCQNCTIELDSLQNIEKHTAELEKRFDAARNLLFNRGNKLNSERQKAAEILERNIGNELADLDMKGSSFKVQLKMLYSSPNELGNSVQESGLDEIEFMISTNPGEPLKPLAKIASGGEMSRIMLAIKKILADVDKMPTLIFDEIDIGISGGTASKIAEKLNFISTRHQIICVTHLAQIAAIADTHFLISKHEEGNRTKTFMTKLNSNEKITEIARIMGGKIETEISLSHAREIISMMESLKLQN
ncbi:MAG: DNA repair protein RecN [Eubacteriales bacterium]|nr:DNA repair protein RecN [Eubacteriales bacterium]